MPARVRPRTGQAAASGPSAPLTSPFLRAEIVQFCSSRIAWQLLAEDPAQIALGDAICDWLIANHEVLKIKYLIWRQQSWSPQRPYWRPMADRGSDTDNHFDHVHISVLE